MLKSYGTVMNFKKALKDDTSAYAVTFNGNQIREGNEPAMVYTAPSNQPMAGPVTTTDERAT